MPELPEVETIRRDLERHVADLAIREVEVRDARVLRNRSAAGFKAFCRNKKIQAVSRRGKAIILHLSPRGYLVVQPMMTGQLIFLTRPQEILSRDTKIVFKLSNGTALIYNDQRLFGRLNAVDNLDELAFLQGIGVEPFAREFTVDKLKEVLKRRTGPIKPLLMNQQVVAGIGNIYASEILFRSHISPRRRARALKSVEVAALHGAVVGILKEAVRFRGTSMRNYRDAAGEKGNFINRIRVYGRDNEECYQCRAPIVKIVQSGRSTFFCRKCQK